MNPNLLVAVFHLLINYISRFVIGFFLCVVWNLFTWCNFRIVEFGASYKYRYCNRS
jgi:hypothetical protein